MSVSKSEYAHVNAAVEKEMSVYAEKRRTLRDLDLFVLDNSLRESTVGQLRGHTLENKWAIFEEVKKCGLQLIIVAAFSHMPRVDDSFVSELRERESDMSKFFAFSEIKEKEDKEICPVGLQKMIEHGIPNPIFEVDLAHLVGKDCIKELCALFEKRFEDTRKHFKDAKILVNIRDLAVAMIRHPDYVFDIVKYLATSDNRIFGIIFEEPMGKFLPEQLGAWTKGVRMIMDESGWQSGHLLAHIHKKWGLAEACVHECLSNGASGIWCSMAEEGAGLGHACSSVTIMNLVRLGNKKVLKYNCKAMRQAAINITKITTGQPPHAKQSVYGERALDIVFDMHSGMGGGMGGEDATDANTTDGADVNEFSLSHFYGVKAPNRITTLASEQMIVDRLVNLFGPNEQFTIEMAQKMKATMIKDLTSDQKEEYMTAVGLAILFDKSGGHLTPKMAEVIDKVKIKSDEHKQLIGEVREIWDKWDISESKNKDGCLEFHSFYNGFMAPYFGCYECEDSRKGLQALDMNHDNTVEWDEFQVFLRWALDEYPDICTTGELLNTAFQKGLIPAMQDIVVKKNKEEGATVPPTTPIYF